MDKFGFNFDTTYIKLPSSLFTELEPKPCKNPSTVIINHKLAKSLGLDFSKASQHELAMLFSGSHLPEGSTPFAQAYAGHQFGHFNLLGDGRAHMLGEHLTQNGQRFDIQLKGSGRTPYSRNGDGKAALAPMLREYIISEAMYHLNIPTTRSLAVATTGQSVERETTLPGAVLTRVASSHIRVGTFQLAATTSNTSLLKALMNYTIQRHYPKIQNTPSKPLALIEALMEKQIDHVINWMRVGFIHGVMNTDNMTLSGETIDYGPCAFMDSYNPQTVFSSIDHTGRYGFANQARIAQWNIARFAETLIPLIDNDTNKAIRSVENILENFSSRYKEKWLTMMCRKLGIDSAKRDDMELITTLLNWMHSNNADYTNTFNNLTMSDFSSNKLYKQKEFKDWYNKWQNRLKENTLSTEDVYKLMRVNNPVLIPRNHKVEEALKAANTGNLKPFTHMLEAISKPYEETEKFKEFQSPPPPSERVYQTFCGT